jgi:hypothetical protein
MAAITILSTIQPRIVFAQTSGVGSDGFTRILWRGTDGSMSIWKLNATLDQVATSQYGPFSGYEPIAITVGTNNFTYVLWRNTSGSISLWGMDSNLNLVVNQQYGPYAGWTAQGLSSSKDALRVIWRHTLGQVSVWDVDPTTLNLLNSKGYGPNFGWDPGAP